MVAGRFSGEAIVTSCLTTTSPGSVSSQLPPASPLNLPATMPEHASQLYARNVQALLELLLGEDGELALNFDDEVVAGACVVREGEAVQA